MKVLKFTFSSNLLSGHSRPAYELGHYLNARGVEVKLFSNRLDTTREALHQKLLVKERLRVEENREINSMKGFILRKYDKQIKEALSWADIVHVYGVYSLFLLHRVIPHNTKVVLSVNSEFKYSLMDVVTPFFSSYKELPNPSHILGTVLPSRLFAQVFSLANATISWTKYMQARVRSLVGFTPPWIPVGVNLQRFNIEPNIVGEDFVFLYLGYLASARGVPELLDAFRIVTRKWPKSRLIIAHTGLHTSEQYRILNRICRDQFGKALQLVGFTPNLSDIINKANVVVLPFRSLVGYSQPPLTVLEALAHGRPVITTSVGCLPELVEDGVNGYCVSPGDRNSLAYHMLRMREADIDQMSKRASKYILLKHSWPEITESTIQTYKKIL